MSQEEEEDEAQNRQDLRTNQISDLEAGRRTAGQFKCVGAVRKAGFLSVKKWIVKRRQSIELARKQGWKRYWVCLRGTALLFHTVVDQTNNNNNNNNEETSDLLSWIQDKCAGQVELVTKLLHSEQAASKMSRQDFLRSMSRCYIEKEPKHLIIVDGSIGQPIPEHPRRDFVFCLSTSFGDAYLFQASCQLESDNWTSAIHNACAASIARDLTRSEAIKLFESKLRQLELEADKKLFLRQRLESRLASMSAISHINQLHAPTSSSDNQQQTTKDTMRSLLQRLGEQLLALDTYIEQLHCEIYQLRCYLTSCSAQQAFFQQLRQNDQQQEQTNQTTASLKSIELPHPKSLLMYVSKPTKLLLIRLGVFTVSSFHAFTHARQESAETILQKVQQSSMQQNPETIELRVKSQSLSEPNLFSIRLTNTRELEKDTENLIQLSDLRPVSVRLSVKLYNKIKARPSNEPIAFDSTCSDSDDRYSVCLEESTSSVIVNMKLHSHSNSASIIKQVLKIIEPKLNELEYVNYYLQFSIADDDNNNNDNKLANKQITKHLKHANDIKSQYITKRKETLDDWNNIKQLEMLEKLMFRVELTRSKIDEESAPFGIFVEAQLIGGDLERQLNVYCSYIEWGSVADKAGLRDEDELVVIKGVPVTDLDMIFVECLIQDGSKLALVVRSSRIDYPEGSQAINRYTWMPNNQEDDDDDDINNQEDHEIGTNERNFAQEFQSKSNFSGHGSQIISDEYISSLVCPPPPSRTSALLLGDVQSNERARLFEKQIDSEFQKLFNCDTNKTESSSFISKQNNNDGLADDLMEKLNELVNSNRQLSDGEPVIDTASMSPNSNERLKKSVLELLETEYAYVKHLETVIEHYMRPLGGAAFLNIQELQLLNEATNNLDTFQRDFLNRLTVAICIECPQFSRSNLSLSPTSIGDELDRLNRVIQLLDLFNDANQFKPILKALADVFISEADKFRHYIAYCINYSLFQKVLHPAQNGGSNSGQMLQPITVMPTALNTFKTSNSSSMLTITSTAPLTSAINYNPTSTQTKDISSILNSIMSNNLHDPIDKTTQLKQLNEFLGNLDSSSSSASLSLPKSSSCQTEQATNNSPEINNVNHATSNATNSNGKHSQQFYKSVHQQNFESYLIKPIQRIVKYPMLLNSIVASASMYIGSQVYSDLQRAIKQMETVINQVNDAQRIHDEYGLVFKNIERLYRDRNDTSMMPSILIGAHQPIINLNLERLLYFGPVEWLNIDEFSKTKFKKGIQFNQILFVFDSCVIFICEEQLKNSLRKKLPITSFSSNATSFICSQQASSISNNPTRALHKSLWKDFNEKIIRYQCLIPVSEVQVRSVPNSSKELQSNTIGQTQQVSYKWELFQCSSSNSNSSLLTKSPSKRQANNNGKVYLLASPSNEIRNAFLRKIRLIIRESVRNMSLPLPKSPSSKSNTSKKLSSPSSEANTNNNSNSSCTPLSNSSPVCKNRNNYHRQLESSGEIKANVDCQCANQVDSAFKTGIKVNY